MAEFFAGECGVAVIKSGEPRAVMYKYHDSAAALGLKWSK